MQTKLTFYILISNNGLINQKNTTPSINPTIPFKDFMFFAGS
jgi:hypothetical protein